MSRSPVKMPSAIRSTTTDDSAAETRSLGRSAMR
jgi:hypothetical protein